MKAKKEDSNFSDLKDLASFHLSASTSLNANPSKKFQLPKMNFGSKSNSIPLETKIESSMTSLLQNLSFQEAPTQVPDDSERVDLSSALSTNFIESSMANSKITPTPYYYKSITYVEPHKQPICKASSRKRRSSLGRLLTSKFKPKRPLFHLPEMSKGQTGLLFFNFATLSPDDVQMQYLRNASE